MNFESFLGSYVEDRARTSVWVELRISPVQTSIKQTTNHEPIPEGAEEIALTGTTYDTTGIKEGARFESRFISGGQIETDNLRRIGRDRLADLWDEWHLNGMTAGCAHQGEEWTCSFDWNAATRETVRRIGGDPDSIPADICGVVNGWPILRANDIGYPRRGDSCLSCGRDRWDEPTDWCPVSGYRFGTSWLYRVPPPEIVAELRAMFGQVAP